MLVKLRNMLKIRLMQTGKRHARQSRIVVAEARSKRDGKYIDLLGFFNKKTGEVKIDKKRAGEWIVRGAQPTEIVRSLLK